MKYLLLFIIIFSLSFVSAIPNDANNAIDFTYPEVINYSTIATVNNTDHFGGYTVATFVTYVQGLFNLVYCELTGCTMAGNIDMDEYNITNVDWATFNNLNVTGTSYLGNLIIEADNITTDNIIPLTSNGVRVWGNLTVNGNISSDWFNGKFNWTSGDDWNIFDGSTLTFNESKFDPTYHNPIQAEVITGTIDGGTLADVQHSDAGYDGVTFNFSEEVGGLDLRLNFTGLDVTTFNRGIMRYKTSDLKGDFPIVQMWNYEDSVWEDYPPVTESETFATMTQPVFDGADHIQGGVAQMRIYKDGGNTQNHYYVDWIAIVSGVGLPVGEEVEPDFNAWLNKPVFEVNVNGSLVNSTWDRITANELNITGTAWIGDLTWNGNLDLGWNNITNVNWINADTINVSGTVIGPDSNFAQYEFGNNNFNGSGNFTTTGQVFGKFGADQTSPAFSASGASHDDTGLAIHLFGALDAVSMVVNDVAYITAHPHAISGDPIIRIYGDTDFQSKDVTGIDSLTATTGNIITDNIGTANIGLIDLGGGSTIDAGTATGNWNLGSGSITTFGNIKADALTSGRTTDDIQWSTNQDETTLLDGIPRLIRYYTGPAGMVEMVRRARGSKASPNFLNDGDTGFTFNFQVWDNGPLGTREGFSGTRGQMGFYADEDQDETSHGTKYQIRLTPKGTETLTTVFEFDGGERAIIPIDNYKFKLGAGENDFSILFDGTSPIYNTTGVHTFINSTDASGGTISVGDIVYSSPENKDYLALDNLVNPIELTKAVTSLNPSGKTEKEFHESFPEELQKTIPVKDPNNCSQVFKEYKWYDKIEQDDVYGQVVPEGIKDYEIIYKEECETKDKLVISGGNWNMFNYKAIYELKQENEEIKMRLCLSNPVECVLDKGIKYIVERIVNEK